LYVFSAFSLVNFVLFWAQSVAEHATDLATLAEAEPPLSISIPHDRTVPASSERGQIRNLLLTTYSIYLQLVCRPLQSGFLLPACYQQPVRNLWIITPRAESSPSNSTTP
jgi:hypothetical protein